MSTITTTDIHHAVEDAAAHLYVWALKDIPQDLPLTGGSDAHGNSLYHDVQAAAQERLKEIFARL
ncbi:MAG: hypothetical protein ACJ75P_11680 [Gaiellaceae bacterium]